MDMTHPQPDDRTRLQRRLTANLVLAALAFVFGWVPYVWATLFNRDVLGHGGPPGGTTTQVYLYLGLVILIAAPLFGWKSYRRINSLLHSGVRGEATIVKIGGVAAHGRRPVKYMFEVNGLTYSFTRDTLDMYLKELGSRRKVPVIYNRADPNQCELMFEKLGTAAVAGPVSTAPAEH
jgi:hypothetical protein